MKRPSGLRAPVKSRRVRALVRLEELESRESPTGFGLRTGLLSLDDPWATKIAATDARSEALGADWDRGRADSLGGIGTPDAGAALSAGSLYPSAAAGSGGAGVAPEGGAGSNVIVFGGSAGSVVDAAALFALPLQPFESFDNATANPFAGADSSAQQNHQTAGAAGAASAGGGGGGGAPAAGGGSWR